MLFLLPTIALAGWRPVNTIAVPVNDVLMVDAGVILEVSGNATGGLMAWKMSDAGVLLNTISGSFAGGGYYGANCLLGLDSGGTLTPSIGCGTLGSVGGTNALVSLRVLSPARAVAISFGASQVEFFAGVGPAGWGSLNVFSGTTNRSLESARVGSIDYVVVNSGSGVRVSVDGGAPPNLIIPGTPGWRDAVPFPMAGAPAILGVLPSSLALLRDYRTPVLFTPTIPSGLALRYAGISGAIGMVTTLTGVVISPIPDPSRPAETWVVRQVPGLFTDKIHCLDDRYCVTSNDAGVVWYWENDTAPGVEVIVPQVDAGQTIRLIADAGDGDGDPIFVTWKVADAGVPSVAAFADGTAIDFTVPAGFCSPTVIDVTVMDGLPAHNRTIQIPVTVIDRGELQTSASSLIAYAGGPPINLRAFVDGGCASANLGWSTSDGGTGTGSNFVWTPPAAECSADGGRVSITATATWPFGTPATSQSTYVIAVEPWGVPDAPVFATPGSQQSPSVVEWLSSGPEHACSASNDFPGTRLTWTYNSDAGAAIVTVVDGGLEIKAPRCTRFPSLVSGSAVRRVVGEQFGRVSAAGPLVVDIVPDAPPLDANTQFDISVQGDGGFLFGILKVDAGCLPERGASANVMVFANGAFVIDGGFPITDGVWSLKVPGGCSGGTYQVIAELNEDAGFSGATAMGTITLDYSPARVGSLPVDHVDVVCGSGARAPLTLIPATVACGAAELTWRVLSGPPLDAMAGTGDTIDLQSSALDFSIVGQQVVVEWVADAGPGNLDLATRTVELAVQPFLEVSVKAHPPLRREEETVSFEVILRNTTECAVDGLSLTLPLSGGTTLPGSVLIDDVHVSSRATDQGLVLDGVSVPASGVTKIQLSARARLLFSPTLEPVASLGPYVVSTSPLKEAPGTGCGCAQLDASAFLALVLLLGVRRRKAA